MKKATYILSLAILIFAYSCERDQEIFNGNGEIQGTLYLVDTNNSSAPERLANQTIYFTDITGQTNSYKYSFSSDANGAFKIRLLEKGSYTIFSKYTRGGVDYSGSTTFQIDEDSITVKDLLLQVTPSNNVLLIFTNALSSERMSKLSFRVYTDSMAARLDSSNLAIIRDSSSIDGEYRKYNLYPNNYYIVCNTRYGPYQAKAFSSFSVDNSGQVYVKNIPVSLTQSHVSNLVIQLNDNSGGAIGNFPVYLYRSKLAAQVNDSLHSYAHGRSDINGKYIQQIPDTGKYYIYASDTFAGLLLSAFDSTTITAGVDSTKTLILQ